MYTRVLEPPRRQSFFLFGPRGVGKTAWLRARFPDALFFDLLDADTYTRLLAAPTRLGDEIPAGYRGWVVLDEIQRLPDLLNEVHRLIEARRVRFVLTGSSALKLRRKGVNLLAGRALTRFMHPLTVTELGQDFDLRRALRYGCLPFACTEPEPRDYLRSYVTTYLREEVQQEGFARNLAAFARFLEAASFSQGSVLNMAAVARESAVNAKVAEDYFSILEDLLIAVRLPVFAKRAKRRVVAHPKFYFFDAGVFQAIRPRGPLDSPEETRGAALETLFLQQLRAVNDYADLGYSLHYWRTAAGDEVDFVLYGERGLVAFEVKMTQTVRPEDLRGLRRFRESYPQAKTFFVYPGSRRRHEAGIEIMPAEAALRGLEELIR
ncbi:MAG: ATP-binding protein [Candidatus Rokubacteria bacterium]|nr:ATP-binding protein [Candidatus Rokubacteria bacterium]MBI3108355.1 ATP-binding protein [Candidatus Rokubacteria bacterium]